MKIVFIGCVEFSHRALSHVLTLNEAQIVGVITRSASSFNSDFRSLEPLAAKADIPCLLEEKNGQTDMTPWIKALNPDVIYCFGWSYLLREPILKSAPLGAIGYHPAALPKNRGRHPLIWALALGLTETASTFFFMDENADSGDILSQEPILIDSHDDASDLYRKMTDTALKQITNITRQLHHGSHQRIPQNHSLANYWRKRGKKDGEIDWRMSARNICNLVRALSKPYLGAHCLFQGEDIKIWKSEVVSNSEIHLEPGKVLNSSSGGVLVKCGQDAVLLKDHGFRSLPTAGSYL